jgi:hypothetical protein
MKKMLRTFPPVPSAGMIIVLIISFLNGCTEEPAGIDREGSLPTVSTDADSRRTFHAHMTGDQERPAPISTDASGQAIFKLSKDGTSLSYKVIVNNLENVTQAHIHCGGTEVAGPVVAFLFGFVPEGVTKNGVLAEGVITAEDIIARPDSEQCMGGLATFDQLIEKIRSGEAYINVHTIAHPPGEIRGVIN